MSRKDKPTQGNGQSGRAGTRGQMSLATARKLALEMSRGDRKALEKNPPTGGAKTGPADSKS